MRLTFIVGVLFFYSQSFAQVFDAVVAADGSGTHSSLSSALSSRSSAKMIFVKNGVYEEKLQIIKDGISLIGENRDSVIIQWADHANDGTHSTGTSFTLLIDSDDVYLENLTVKNTAGKVGQAVAVHTKGQRIAVKNCHFTGYQDTYFVAGGGMVYNLNCHIEGDTDFIFGDATAVFDDCIIESVSNGSYVTAPEDSKLTSTVGDKTIYHGILFEECQLIASANVGDNSCSLMRPWQPNASSVFVNCVLGGHIKDEGFSVWSGNNNHESGFYGEFGSKEADGTAVDVSNRSSWSHQLTQEEVDNYYNREYYFTKSGSTWDPLPIISALAAPVDVNTSFLDQSPEVIQWAAVTDAIGYAVLRDGQVIGFSETNTFEDTEGDLTKSRIYSVKSVSGTGALSEASTKVVADARITLNNQKKINDQLQIRLIGNEIQLSERAEVVLYSLTGQKINEAQFTNRLILANNLKGVYVLKAHQENREIITRKFILK